MSILQEYEMIRRKIGEKEYNNICQFLEENPGSFLSDVYYNLNDGDRRYTKWKIRRIIKPTKQHHYSPTPQIRRLFFSNFSAFRTKAV